MYLLFVGRFDSVDGPRKKDNDPNCALCIAALASSLSACTNPYAALVGAYWGRLLVLLLERRRVAGQEPPSERQSEGQPG